MVFGAVTRLPGLGRVPDKIARSRLDFAQLRAAVPAAMTLPLPENCEPLADVHDQIHVVLDDDDGDAAITVLRIIALRPSCSAALSPRGRLIQRRIAAVKHARTISSRRWRHTTGSRRARPRPREDRSLGANGAPALCAPLIADDDPQVRSNSECAHGQDRGRARP